MNNSITKYQLFTLTFFLSHGFLTAGFLKKILNLSGTSIIFAILLGTIFGIAVLGIFQQARKKELFSLLKNSFPKYLSILFYSIILASFFLLAAFLLKEHSYYITANFLKNDSPLFVSILFLAICFYIASQKIETIARFSELLFYIFLFLFLFVLIGLIPLGNSIELKPMGTSSILEGALFYFLNTTLPLFLLTMIPKEKKQKEKKYFFSSYLTSSLILLILALLILSLLGINLAKVYPYPEMTILKKITYFSFFERMEGSFSILYLFSSSIFLSLLLYGLKTGTNSLFKKGQKIISSLLFLGILFLSYLGSFNYEKIVWYLGILYLSLTLLFTLMLKYSKQKST